MTQPYPPLALAATLLLAVILTACAPMPPVSEVEAAGQEPHEVPFRRGGYPTLAPLLRQVTPAVVNVAVETTLSEQDHPFLSDPNFRRFLETLDIPFPESVEGGRQQSVGSGLIVDAAHGYVLTNAHVIKNASRITVTLKDRRSFSARLLGTDPRADIAVLVLTPVPSGLSALQFGDSDRLEVGDFVLAIGNPFGLDYSLTTGVISALDRTIQGEQGQSIQHLIQTDAAINPGNSGGPLLDSAGRLIGVNTAIFSPSGAFAGIGFAVPVDTVNRVVPELIAHGHFQRPTLGIKADDAISDRVLGQLGLSGVLVLQVEPGSAAERAGLRGTKAERGGGLALGDIILAVNDEAVDSLTVLIDLLERHKVGDQVILTLDRAGETHKVAVLLQGRKAQ
jgi:S1-C subfamily serine protease